MFEAIYASHGLAGLFVSGLMAAGIIGATGLLVQWLVMRARQQGLDARLLELREDLAAAQADKDRQAEALAELSRQRSELEQEVSALRERARRLTDVEADRERLRTALSDEQRQSEVLKTRLAEQQKSLQEKLALLEKSKEEMSRNFENLANRILEEKSEKFSKENSERLQNLLNPLKQQISTFQSSVTRAHEDDIRGRSDLQAELRNLRELNKRLGDEALSLTRALKGDSKARGNWGEVSLKRLLENSGLTEGREFRAEQSHRDEDGRLFRPDFIIKLPNGRDVVIDSKVALNAYVECCDAEDDESRAAAMKQHLLAMRTHVKSLSDKDYASLHGINSLDFVLMFVPLEGAFIDALKAESALFEDAFSQKRIVIVSATTLFAVLRTIAAMWQMEYRNRNAEEIADRAGRLYDKFVLFAESLLDVGKELDSARACYDMAMNRLRDGSGNLIGQVQKLQDLGAKSAKEMPAQLKVLSEEEA